jgi:cytochrome b561
MCFKNTLQTFGVVAKAFHWVMAVLIICLLAIGLTMANMENSPDRFKLIGWHKEFGIVALFLVCLRLGWKALNVSPMLPDTIGKIAKLGAHLSHTAVYILMFAMPITGWLMSSAAGLPISMFGLFAMPDLIEPDREFGRYMRELHGIFAWTLIGFITLHILAALLHHFYFHDNVLRRMLPNFRGKNGIKNSDYSTGC